MSHNRSHLVPTAITNKNGVQTIVHKKPALESQSNTKLPAATLPNTNDRETLEHKTALALTTENYGTALTTTDHKHRAANYRKVRRMLETYSDETLHRFAHAATTELCWSLESILITGIADEEYLNDWITVEPITSDKDVDSVPFMVGLKEYKNLAPQKDGHYPPRRETQLIALARVTAHLGENGHGIIVDFTDEHAMSNYIDDPKLRDLITSYDDPAAVADLIIQRNLTDPDQITALLDTMNNTANAITNGIL